MEGRTGEEKRAGRKEKDYEVCIVGLSGVNTELHVKTR